MPKLHDASNLEKVKYGCSEYALKRLTGIDILAETGLGEKEVGFENLPKVTKGKCVISRGSISLLASGKLNYTILRIKPRYQRDLHSVLLIDVDEKNDKIIIEDQNGRQIVPLTLFVKEWAKTGYLYARCKNK